MKTVGADLHIRPKLPFSTTATACAPNLRKPPQRVASVQTSPLAPLGFGSHKLDSVRRIMYESSNQVKVLHDVTPIDLLAQSAVLLVQTQRVSGGHVGLLKKYCHAS